jgi:glycosyltransferase involved in cell wall biosynthesis
MTKISIVIPVHNSVHCLRETLEHALAQTYPAHEIIVVDDGSTDATGALVESFGDRVRYIRQENAGASAARNNGIQNATGDWIAFLDHDDLFLPDKLQRQQAIVEANPELAVVYSGFTYLAEDGSKREALAFPSSELWPAIRYRTPVLPSTALVRRDALLAVGGFRSGPRVRRVEDWDLWFRLMQRYSVRAFQSIPESLLLYRVLPNSESKGIMPMAANAIYMLDTLLLDGLSGITRALWKRRIEARIYNNLAISLRENGDDRFWAFAIESMLRWPFFGRIVPGKRYLVVANMLYKRLRSPRLRFRYWWPDRNCREELLHAVLPDEPTARGAVTS